jgi:hypothetical protein
MKNCLCVLFVPSMDLCSSYAVIALQRSRGQVCHGSDFGNFFILSCVGVYYDAITEDAASAICWQYMNLTT